MRKLAPGFTTAIASALPAAAPSPPQRFILPRSHSPWVQALKLIAPIPLLTFACPMMAGAPHALRRAGSLLRKRATAWLDLRFITGLTEGFQPYLIPISAVRFTLVNLCFATTISSEWISGYLDSPDCVMKYVPGGSAMLNLPWLSLLIVATTLSPDLSFTAKAP